MKITCLALFIVVMILTVMKSFAQAEFNFGPVAGINASGVYHNKCYYESQTKEHHSFGVHPVFGVTAGIFSQLKWKHLSLDLQVIYSQSGKKTVYINDPEKTTEFWYYYKNVRHYEFAYLQMPVTLNYHFRIKKMHPFAGFGMVPSYTIRAEAKQSYSHDPEMNYTNNFIEESKNDLMGYTPRELQFTSVIGAKLNDHMQACLSYTVGGNSLYFYPYSCMAESFTNKTLSFQLRYLIRNRK